MSSTNNFLRKPVREYFKPISFIYKFFKTQFKGLHKKTIKDIYKIRDFLFTLFFYIIQINPIRNFFLFIIFVIRTTLKSIFYVLSGTVIVLLFGMFFIAYILLWFLNLIISIIVF